MDRVPTMKFDPEEHHNNVYDVFTEFIEEFTYEYDAFAKEPPNDLDAAGKAAWILQNKRKVSLGRFASRNLEKDYKEATTAEERPTNDAMMRASMSLSWMLKPSLAGGYARNLGSSNASKNTLIRVDAHRSGLSAILMQGNSVDYPTRKIPPA